MSNSCEHALNTSRNQTNDIISNEEIKFPLRLLIKIDEKRMILQVGCKKKIVVFDKMRVLILIFP